MSNALPQFRQSGMGAIGRLTEEAQARASRLEEVVKGRYNIDQLKDMANQQGLRAVTDLGSNISTGGLEIHSIYSLMKNKDLLKKIADAKDLVRKKYSKGTDEAKPEETPEEAPKESFDVPTREVVSTRQLEYGAEPTSTLEGLGEQNVKVGDIAKDPDLFSEFLERYDTGEQVNQIAINNNMLPEQVEERMRQGFMEGKTIRGVKPTDEYAVSRQPKEPTQEPLEPEPEAPTSELAETSFGKTPMTSELGDIESGATKLATEGGEGLFSGLGEALGGVGEAISGVASTVGEALGPLGIIAGLGFGIYDEIEEQKQATKEKAQATATQNELNELANKPTFSVGSRALPSFDTSRFRSGGLMNF